MLSFFNCGFKITQEFGVNKKYYKKYGLEGHNGLDGIPKLDDWHIVSVFGGKIIKRYYNQSYGNRIVIWNKKKNIIECHNHLDSFDPNINEGNTIKPGCILGIMGNTGDSFGAHNHFQIAKVDSQCMRIEYNNGFFGYTDPLPYLKGEK